MMKLSIMRPFLLLSLFIPAALQAQAPDFNTHVKPVLNKSCAPCHNERNASGSVNIIPFTEASSLHGMRDEWERILGKIRSGEMPPKGFPKPPQAQIDQLIAHVRSEFEKADAKIAPDPGRVTARRLNRTEYTNTIRDLLGVDFHADQTFPTDDSGHGFDNIGEVLTISPLLMEKYLQAAEKISARALGLETLPKKPLDFEYHLKDKRARRTHPSSIEAQHRVEWDAEYLVTIGMPGERPDGKPVTLGFFMDGKLIHSQTIETKPSGLVYFNPFSDVQFRVSLPAGDHTFRATFLNDEFIQTLPKDQWFKDKVNKTMSVIKFTGPFTNQAAPASRARILTCDPNTSDACVTRILQTLGRRAYRRPIAPAEVAQLKRFVTLAKSEGQSTEHGLQVAITAMLVSPHFLFRIERDRFPNQPDKTHPVSNLELASRLSYFLWSSMPDDELLTLAEQAKLNDPKTLEAQVRRMLRDPKSNSLAANFAGQWLETRNLASVKPDPKKFPEWNPELRDAMQQETRLFFDHILKENLPISTFLNADFTFVNETLAKHYGIPGIDGTDFRRITVNDGKRGGILTHASVLTVSSYPTRTSPVIRGKYLLENVFGTPPPPPPPDVPTLDEDQVGNAGSMRAQLEKHRSNAVCASCHNRMDTLGFALENYDATGKWRDRDGNFAIEPAGTLPNGKSFQTPAELRQVLAGDLEEFNRCLTEKMMTYALGRGLQRYDRRSVEQVSRAVAADGYRFQTLIFEVVKSLPFQYKRADAPKRSAAKPAQEIAHR